MENLASKLGLSEFGWPLCGDFFQYELGVDTGYMYFLEACSGVNVLYYMHVSNNVLQNTKTHQAVVETRRKILKTVERPNLGNFISCTLSP